MTTSRFAWFAILENSAPDQQYLSNRAPIIQTRIGKSVRKCYYSPQPNRTAFCLSPGISYRPETISDEALLVGLSLVSLKFQDGREDVRNSAIFQWEVRFRRSWTAVFICLPSCVSLLGTTWHITCHVCCYLHICLSLQCDLFLSMVERWSDKTINGNKGLDNELLLSEQLLPWFIRPQAQVAIQLQGPLDFQ